MKDYNNPYKLKLGFCVMENPLTPEKKAEYNLIKEDFQKKRDIINKDIRNYEIDVIKAEKEISNLEKEVENMRPLIEGCDKHIVCSKCDIYSMKFLGSTPNPDKYFIYECVICGHEDTHT